MTFDAWTHLNWLAVIVAALAYFVIGAVWYAPPVFGAMWMAAGGMTRDQTEGGPGPAVFAVPLVGSLLSALTLGMLAVASGTDTLSEGIVLGFIVAIGFALAISFVTATFEATKPRPLLWGAVNAGYHIVGTVVAGAIIGAWQ